eukprot:TRINITY_DN21870_c0_g1_i12.p1 TRINITY_DN21870_c0_g1~~TRINITY_DN21870_c0_g1_i12.p1  ORF type:complete len:687 (+),score=160.79 TRINITY_DN21870_c0_g1_i12:87-2147(+)
MLRSLVGSEMCIRDSPNPHPKLRDQRSSEGFGRRVARMRDASVSPCQDFYKHACGRWEERFKLPERRSQWTYSFSGIAHKVNAQLKTIMLSGLGDPRISQFYKSCTDVKKLDAVGVTRLRQLVEDHVPGVASASSFVRQLASLRRETGLEPLFHFGVDTDPKHPASHMLSLTQGGISLPDREYFLKDSHKPLIQEMRLLIKSTLAEYSANPNADISLEVVAFETALAQIMLSKTALRDPVTTYHTFTHAQIQQKWPLIGQYIQQVADGLPIWGVSDRNNLLCPTPTFFDDLESLLGKTSPQVLQAYLVWRLETLLAGLLPDGKSQRFFKFFGTALSGQLKREHRDERCVHMTSNAMPELVGKVFAVSALGEGGRREAEKMITSIEASFKEVLGDTEWLSATTRTKALDKLSKVTNKVGYPNKWREYRQLQLVDGALMENFFRVGAASSRHQLEQISLAVDPDHWDMGVFEVNAYYDPSKNTMVFPAAILQDPMYNATFPLAANYGGIGAVMGHELTHGFDDSGSQYDKDGKMENWWTESDRAEFKKRTECVASEYGQFKLPDIKDKPSKRVNGHLTLGEDLADNGGVHAAYHAMQAALKDAESTNESGAMSHDQMFFYAFAHTWCSKARAEQLRLQALTDPHAPAADRVNGVVKNSPEFASAFKCTSGSKMSPRKRCRVWGSADLA